MASNLSKTAGSRPVRTFIALEIPEPVQERLSAVRCHLPATGTAVRWLPQHLLHLTLRFLGSVELSRLPAVDDAAAAGAAASQPFSLRIAGIGAFPRMSAPRVIWAGIQHDAAFEALRALFQHLDDALAARGFGREERGLSPHITLARTRDGISAQERRRLGDSLQRVGRDRPISDSFAVGALTVMRSDLGPEGTRYTPLRTVTLGETIAPGRDEL